MPNRAAKRATTMAAGAQLGLPRMKRQGAQTAPRSARSAPAVAAGRKAKERDTAAPAAPTRRSVLDDAPEELDLLSQRLVGGDHALDLAHRMQHRGVIAAAEALADFRK